MRECNMTAQNLIEFNGIIDAIYAGNAETPPWRTFLRHLKEKTESMYTCIAFGDEESWSGRIHYLESDSRRSLDDGQDHSDFLRFSPFTPLPQDVVATMCDLAKRGQPAHPEFIARVTAPLGIGDIIGVNFARHGKQVANLRLGRSRAAGRYSSQDKELCALMLPHLRRACAEVSGTANAPAWQSLLFETLRILGIGVMLMDARCQILDASDLALEVLTAHRQLLSVSNGLLRPHGRTQAHAVTAAVARALDGDQSQAVRLQGGGSGDDLHLVCMRSPEVGMRVPQRRVIVFVSCGQRPRPIEIRMLRDLFGLSSAEAQVALGLISGLSIAEIAVTNSISRNTVYSHLKAAFDKVGVSQQSALVSRMLGSVAVLGSA